jgi:heme/copper-type cytochrome/quinol oxidase subunit 2
MPYPEGGQLPDKVIFVAAKQFAFGISETPITSEEQWEAASQGPAVRVPANALVEFRVSSLDVNHGFAVYSPGGTLLAQTQSMPGYVNRLRMRFQHPGRYPVLCLELCGMEHHSMRGVFDVFEPGKEATDAAR